MLEFPPVLTKDDFTVRYAAGEFGNASPTWLTLKDFVVREEQFRNGLFHLRNRVAGGETHYNQSKFEVAKLWTEKDNPDNWYCSAMVPKEVEETLLIQGEVMQPYADSGRCGLDLYCTNVPKPMRQALRERSKQLSGIIAVETLRYYLCPDSYEWLSELLQRYPGHVVEFSTYCRRWGTLPGYNTIFWEVRAY